VPAQTWAATFTLAVQFVFRLILGLVAHDVLDVVMLPLGLSVPFLVVGDLLALVAAAFEKPQPAADVDWDTLASINSYPGFFGAAVPLFIVIVVYTALDHSVPLMVASIEVDRFDWQDSFKLGVIAVGVYALVAIGGAWLVRALGLQRGLFVALMLTVVAQGFDLFQLLPRSRALYITDTVFSGLGLGGALAGVWAAIAIAVPQGGASKYVGLLVGFAVALQGMAFVLIGVNFSFFLLIVAAILAVSLPTGETKADGYDTAPEAA
jgi:hypothetical protein